MFGDEHTRRRAVDDGGMFLERKPERDVLLVRQHTIQIDAVACSSVRTRKRE